MTATPSDPVTSTRNGQAPVTLLTGASGGIVGALAAILARAGHRLVLSGLDQPGLDAVAAEVAAAGGQAVALAADLRERDFARILVDLAVKTYGRLDHLVTGAGASRPPQSAGRRTPETAMTLAAYLLFLPACFAINMAFGPNNLLSVTNGARYGIGPAVAAAGGRLVAFARVRGIGVEAVWPPGATRTGPSSRPAASRSPRWQ